MSQFNPLLLILVVMACLATATGKHLTMGEWKSGREACFVGAQCSTSFGRVNEKRIAGQVWFGARSESISGVRTLAMKLGTGETARYSWNEQAKEISVSIRMPAWVKGKSVKLDLTKDRIKLALEGEEKSVIEGTLRGNVHKDNCYWTMEELPDGGKMLYLMLEKAPEISGTGPWMGVVTGEDQIGSNYPEEKKARTMVEELAQSNEEAVTQAGADEEQEEQEGGEGGPQVGEDGFCRDRLKLVGADVLMVARQVPANGNAMFHAISASQDYYNTGYHPSLEEHVIEPKSMDLRKLAVDFLAKAVAENKMVFVQGRTMAARELVGVVAQRTGIDTEEYLNGMQSEDMTGGGPEIVALTHILERPIHVYELFSTGLRWGVKRMACFGSPLYDSKNTPLHLLSTYAMFPSSDPGTQTDRGNHYVALFPEGQGAMFIE